MSLPKAVEPKTKESIDLQSRRRMIKMALSTLVLGGFGTMPARVIPQAIVKAKASEMLRAQIKDELTHLVTAYGQLDFSLQFCYDTDRRSPYKDTIILPTTNIDLILDIYEQENPKFTSWAQFTGYAVAKGITWSGFQTLTASGYASRRSINY